MAGVAVWLLLTCMWRFFMQLTHIGNFRVPEICCAYGLAFCWITTFVWPLVSAYLVMRMVTELKKFDAVTITGAVIGLAPLLTAIFFLVAPLFH